MKFEPHEFRKAIRIVCDRDDWPSQGAGWITVPMPADPRDIDVLLVSREGPVADLAAHGVPIVAAPDIDTPLRLLKVSRGAVFIDDEPEAIQRVLRRACRV